MNGVGVVRAVHRWRSESSISLSEIEISFKEVMLLRRIKQSEAYGLIRRALVSMRSDGKRACLMNWKYGCKLVVWCVDWEARAVERAAAADAALAKAMVKALTLAPTLTLTLAPTLTLTLAPTLTLTLTLHNAHDQGIKLFHYNV